MNAFTSSMAQEIENILNTGKAYSNERSRMNECSSGQKLSKRTRRKKKRNEERPLLLWQPLD